MIDAKWLFVETICANLPTNLVRGCLDSDWTEDKLALKIGQIKKIIDALPVRPSILGLVEVENENVVRRLATALGYQKFVMSDRSDARGIDVAVLFNESTDVRFITRKFHAPDFASIGGKSSRDILEAQFGVGPRGETISVLMNH